MPMQDALLEQARIQAAQELERLKSMVLTWKASYVDMADGDGTDDHLVWEFVQEIEEYMGPFVRRMHMTQQLDDDQVSAFWDFCYGQVKDLRSLLST
ncbi:hypothetical protein [Desulfosoma sp.]|uniref:hypothetical protein n=2 Tax=Desulfosoma sp. TaxID=2603217 RepID=UPI00404B50A3